MRVGSWITVEKVKNCPKIKSFAQAIEDPQVLANRMVVEMAHPRAGTLRLLGTPVRLSDTPATLRLAPPDLGQDTEDVMRELGYTDAEIAALSEQGAFD